MASVVDDVGEVAGLEAHGPLDPGRGESVVDESRWMVAARQALPAGDGFAVIAPRAS